MANRYETNPQLTEQQKRKRFYSQVYWTTRAKGLKRHEVAKLMAMFTAPEFHKRLGYFRRLQDAHYTHKEAWTIITATSQGTIQELNLDDKMWVEAMQGRIDVYNGIIGNAYSKGSNPEAIIKEWRFINIRRNTMEKKSAGYDFLRECYDVRKKERKLSFSEALAKTKSRQQQKFKSYRSRY